MERTVHTFETFLWTLQDEWFILSNLLLTEQSSEPFNSNCTNHGQSLGVKCSLSHSFSVEFGAIVSGTWNQPAYKNQTELQKRVVFSTSKKYNPQIGDFGATETALTSAPLFARALSETALVGSRPETGNWIQGQFWLLNCLNSGQPVLFFSFLPLLSYLFLFFPLGNGLKPAQELVMVYSDGKLKKLDEIRSAL